MASENDGNNVEYLKRKPGFYKKGPGKFMLYFGTLEELVEEAERSPELEAVDFDPDGGPDSREV